MKCKKCGANIDSNSRYCVKCGTIIDHKPFPIKIITIITLIIVLLFIAIFRLSSNTYKPKIKLAKKETIPTIDSNVDRATIKEPEDIITFIDQIPWGSEYIEVLKLVDSNFINYSNDSHISVYLPVFNNIDTASASIMFLFKDKKLNTIEIDIYQGLTTTYSRDGVFLTLKDQLTLKYPYNTYSNSYYKFYTDKSEISLEAYGDNNLVLMFSSINK